MNILLTVLSVIAATAGGLLLLVALIFLILLPIKAEIIIGYNKEESFFLRVRYSAVSIDIFPLKKGKKKKKDDRQTSKKQDKTGEESDKTEEKEKKENFFSKKIKAMVVDDYLTLLGHVGDFLTRFRFGDINANLVIASADAATTAKIYGTTTAVVFPILGKIHNGKLAKDIDVHINADFTAEKTYADVYIEIYVRTIHAIALALKALLHILKIKETNNGK
ncbi:MAG: DUF2953 domain-containing protein [Ruminococcaceae bacterium]|nr:DUF2953 domain-containing protein [Oscillospiraceae bacterium]